MQFIEMGFKRAHKWKKVGNNCSRDICDNETYLYISVYLCVPSRVGRLKMPPIL